MIAYHGFGNWQRHGRKPLVNLVSCAAVADVADELLTKSYFSSNRGSGHTQNARVDSIGSLGTFGNQRHRQMEVAMREETLERKLVEAVKVMGGIAPKFTSPGFDGMPDRLILLPGGHMAFAEMKAPGKPLRPLQVKQKRQLESLGFQVYVIDNPDQIGGALNAIQSP
jgi:hypothetical protein